MNKFKIEHPQNKFIRLIEEAYREYFKEIGIIVNQVIPSFGADESNKNDILLTVEIDTKMTDTEDLLLLYENKHFKIKFQRLSC